MRDDRARQNILYDLECAACAVITIALNEELFNAPDDAQGLIYLASRIKEDVDRLQGIAWGDEQAAVKAILAKSGKSKRRRGDG